MPYATQNDLVTRFGAAELVELTDRQNTGAPNAASVAAALSDAGALVDGYLVARYAVPVTPTPELLRRLEADIARYMLWGSAATEAVRTVYEDALKLLRDLADGRAALAGAQPASGAAVPAAAAGQVRMDAPDRRLGGGTLSEFFG
jgi:phage gp36-like protein